MIRHCLVDRVLFGSHRLAGPLQVILQHLLRGPRPAVFDLDGHPFHCTTAHRYFFDRENYERDLRPVLLRHSSRNSVVYDVGAHFGFWIVRLSGFVRHLYGFEPSPRNLEFLRKNVSGLPNVTLVEAAVGATRGEIAFCEKGSMSVAGGGSLKLPMIALDDFVANNDPPDLLLIDIEGYAGEALRGAHATLAAHPTIICEIHNPSENEAVGLLLSNFGYIIDRNSSHYPYRIVAFPLQN